MPFLPPNQQRQSTEGNADCSLKNKLIVPFIVIFGTHSFPYAHATYLAHSHQQAESEYRSEAAESCEDGKQQCQSGRPCHTEQEQHFPANLLRQRASNNLRRRVAVEEPAENETLHLHVPVERARLQQASHAVIYFIDLRLSMAICRVTVLGKLFTPIVPLFTKQRNL